MKTSNIILSSIIGSISLVIVAAEVQLRLTGVQRTAYYEHIYSDVTLPAFKYLVIKESINLSITHSDETKIVVYNAEGQNKPDVEYHQSGDTLFIDKVALNPGDRTLVVTVKTPSQNLVSVNAVNSAFSFMDFPTRLLRIDLDNTRLNFQSDGNVKMGNLDINEINNSDLYISDVHIDTLNLQLNHSEAKVFTKVSRLKGSMTDHASLLARDVNDLEFKKDSTSELR